MEADNIILISFGNFDQDMLDNAAGNTGHEFNIP